VRILANENVPGEIVQGLRAQGHDIVWIRTEAPGSADSEVLALAQTEKRIIVTFDKDFGELAFRWGLPATCGIILIRLLAPSSTQLQQAVLTALKSRQEQDWVGMFSVVEAGRVRITPLPASK
jgi:predicted nuclease of predicted toxin-antitoxin system